MPGPTDLSPDDPFVQMRRVVQIWFVGLECAVRQESEDEIYGTVGVMIPSNQSVSIHPFPVGAEFVPMGKDGQRTERFELLLYAGPPADIVLSSTLVEHDSGDISEYKRRIADKLAEGAAMGGAALGVPSEAVAASEGWIGDLSIGLINVLAGWLGADDDPYMPQATRISAHDWLQAFGVATGTLAGPSPFANRTMERDDTPGLRLKYNLDPVPVSGTDQGGDTGRYVFYYAVDLLVDGEKVLDHAA